MMVLTFLRLSFISEKQQQQEFELELSWICPESKGQHEMVPKEIKAQAERLAKAALDDGMKD